MNVYLVAGEVDFECGCFPIRLFNGHELAAASEFARKRGLYLTALHVKQISDDVPASSMISVMVIPFVDGVIGDQSIITSGRFGDHIKRAR